MICRLCSSSSCRQILVSDSRRFLLCNACGLIFVPEEDHLSLDQERRRYDLHDNDAGNTGYIGFLQEVVSAIERYMPPPRSFLDYGCGKNQVLTGLLRERGYACTGYDPLYGIGIPDALEKTYDGIVLCEVIEHIRDLEGAGRELKLLLKAGGTIVIRTKLYPSIEGLGGWWYKNDSTHINFFTRSAIELLAQKMALGLVGTEKSDIFMVSSS